MSADDSNNESEVHNVIGSREVGGLINVLEATEEFDRLEERDNWTGRVWYLNEDETVLLWESGTILVVGGATTEDEVDSISERVQDRLDAAGLIHDEGPNGSD